MNERMEIIRDEVKLLSEKVNHLDKLRFSARQFAATISMGVVSVGAIKEVHWLFAIAVLSPLPFWITEACYRSYQQMCIKRLVSIQEHLQEYLNGNLTTKPSHLLVPNVFGGLGAQGKAKPFTSFCRGTMILFYIPLMLIGLAALLLTLD